MLIRSLIRNITQWYVPSGIAPLPNVGLAIKSTADGVAVLKTVTALLQSEFTDALISKTWTTEEDGLVTASARNVHPVHTDTETRRTRFRFLSRRVFIGRLPVS